MDSIEEYIRGRKRLFEEEPAAGHFERLQQKMNRGYSEFQQFHSLKESPKPTVWRWTMSIAASIAILVSAGLLWYNSMTQHGTMVCENADDMKFCYLNKMNIIAGQIEELVRDFDQWERHEIMNDVQNIIASADNDFESELPEELPDDVAKAILSEYYRQNLEGLEMIAQTVRN